MGYLLLRDNKQTGPYSSEEIIAKGFKPYDLIWAEGKSAGWRYPGELPEFAAHAPMVEEQPFDRFYKKPSLSEPEKKPSTSQTQTSPALSKEPLRTEKTMVPKERPVEVKPEPVSEAVAAKIISIQTRKVFVTLPGNTVVPAVTKVTAPKAVINEEDARYMPQPEKQAMAAKAPQPIQEQKPNPSYPHYQDSPQFVNDRLKEQADTLYIAPKTQKNTARVFLTSAVAVCLLLGGVIIGLLISNSKQTPEQEQLNARLQQIKDRNSGKTVVSPPVQEMPESEKPQNLNSPVPPGTTAMNLPETNEPVSIAKPAVSKTAIAADDKSIKEPIPDEPQNKTTADLDVPKIPDGNTREVRRRNSTSQETAGKNIYDLVTISGSKYKVGVLGGISNLELTVSNNSTYPIDQVEVSINYMNVEKRVVRTENIIVNDVAAGEQKTVPVAKSKRGVTVSYTITKINSRALAVAHNGL